MSAFTQTDIVEALSSCKKAVRSEAENVFAILTETCPKALMSHPEVAESYLQKRALNVYRHADSNEKLEALWRSMRALYVFKSNYQALIQPVEFRPLQQRETFINENNPVFLLQMLLMHELEKAVNCKQFHKRSETERYLLHALSLAKRTHISDAATLVSLLNAEEKSLICFKDSNRACLLVEKTQRRRIWFDAAALLHWRRARELSSNKQEQRHLHSQFAKWWHIVRSFEPRLVEVDLSFDDALLAINFQTTSLANEQLSSLTTPLSDTALRFALAGQKSRQDNNSETQRVSRKRQRKTAVAALLNSNSDEQKRLCVDEEQRLALSALHRADNADRQLIDSVRNILSDYDSRVHTHTRTGKVFDDARTALERLLSNVLTKENKQKPSFIAQLIVLFCTDLFIHGSTVKDNIKPSSVKNYLSTIKVFVSETLTDERLLLSAQSSTDALYELTHVLAGSISDLEAADKQSTVLRFLQYVHEVSELHLYDFEELELCGVTVESVRSHFIPAQSFDNACKVFLATRSNARVQTVLFLQLCYYAGLRRNETLLLDVDDISAECDALYVTKFAGRKTVNAPRRISLSVFPNDIYSELLDYCDRRRKTTQTLFDEKAVRVHEREFVELMRTESGISDLVVHSLRHSAANNLLFVLTQCAFPKLRNTFSQYFFALKPFQKRCETKLHSLFSERQAKRLFQALSREGRALDDYFPVLDFLAMALGHATPGTSAASYFHLFELVVFELSSLRKIRVRDGELMNVLPQTNSRFDIKRRVAASRDPESVLFKSAINGLKSAQKLTANTKKAQVRRSERLSFSDFCDALYDYQHLPAIELNIGSRLQCYFDSLIESPGMNSINNLSSQAYPAWIRLQEQMSQLRWTSVERNAILGLRGHYEEQYVRDKRSAGQVLRAFMLLNINFTAIEISRDDITWRDLIEDFGYEVRLPKDEQGGSKQRIAMRIKPLYLRWPLWEELAWILDTLILYADFMHSHDGS